MKNTLLFTFSLFCTPLLFSQIIWSEPFTYLDGTTVGADNNAPAGADWTSSCATCLGGDYFEVRSGLMEGHDTNGPGILTTEVIDISAYPAGVEFFVTMLQAGTNPMETCGATCDCNCADWIQVEYSLNGGAFVDVTTPAGGTCGAGFVCAPDAYAVMGDFAPLTLLQSGITGNTLQLRVSVQSWAGNEIHQLDNIIVSEPNVLPVDLLSFEGTIDNRLVSLAWEGEREVNMVSYIVQRKMKNQIEFEEIGSVEANGKRHYEFFHLLGPAESAVYQLKMLNVDGSYTLSHTIELAEQSEAGLQIYPNPATEIITFEHPSEQIKRLEIYDLTGRLVRAATVEDTQYILQIGEFIPSLYQYKVITNQSVEKGRFVKR